MNFKIVVAVLIFCTVTLSAWTQIEKESADSMYIEEMEGKSKVLHAEPLYIDLIRDLGARKGEKEWNVGMGLTDKLHFDTYEALVEYEWAPINRLGLEVELPFSFHSNTAGLNKDLVPNHQLNSIKTAAQWSFLVNQERSVSMALGYINEFEMNHFRGYTEKLVTGNVFNPFFVLAKRWGNNFHTLIYTGPQFQVHYGYKYWDRFYDVNTSLHYMIPGTKNFIGLETNKSFMKNDYHMVVRPQMRLSVSEHVLVGIVAGIPVSKKNERFSTFLRLIWEPKSH